MIRSFSSLSCIDNASTTTHSLVLCPLNISWMIQVATTGTKGDMAHRLIRLDLAVPGFHLDSDNRISRTYAGEKDTPLTVLALLRASKKVLEEIAMAIGVGKSGTIDAIVTRIVIKVCLHHCLYCPDIVHAALTTAMLSLPSLTSDHSLIRWPPKHPLNPHLHSPCQFFFKCVLHNTLLVGRIAYGHPVHI